MECGFCLVHYWLPGRFVPWAGYLIAMLLACRGLKWIGYVKGLIHKRRLLEYGQVDSQQARQNYV
jgi:hypothetical protein